MRCSECNLAIDFDSDVKVQVVYSDDRFVEEHCKHNPFDETDPNIIAVLGSQDCKDKWMKKRDIRFEEQQPKTVATIKQTNPDVLMLPVLRNGELIGKMSLRREALPTDNIPFRFAIGYTVEEGKMSVYEVSLVCSEKNSKMCDSRLVPSKCCYHDTGGDKDAPCANNPAVVG